MNFCEKGPLFLERVTYDKMLSDVRHHLKAKYSKYLLFCNFKSSTYSIAGEVTGKGRIPYSHISHLDCIVTGLPEGVIFKQPKEYNAEDLRKMYNGLDNIKFLSIPPIEPDIVSEQTITSSQ